MAFQRTVLIVEDDQHFREALELVLQRGGYRVLSAADGETAKTLFVEPVPDVAILDMMLPGQSGFQITQHLKEQSEGRIVVIMISGNSSAAHRDYASVTGVDRFLPKPFTPAKVLEVVEELCPPKPTARINGSGVTSRPTALPV
jgi:two-component system phosphate regulon response regulator PhoB